jgi:hypothetical protein
VDKAEAEDIIYANLTELNENGEALEGGINEKPVSMVASLVEDKKTQKNLLGSERGAEMTVDIQKLFNGNEGVISSSLGIAREGVNDLNPNFKLVITDIKRRTVAELNEDYFKEVFGPVDYPKTEAEYRERIKSNLENYYRNEADLWVNGKTQHSAAGCFP